MRAAHLGTVYYLQMNLEKNVEDLIALSRELIAECKSADGGSRGTVSTEGRCHVAVTVNEPCGNMVR